MTFCYFIINIMYMLWTYELVIVNYCDLHIAVTDVPLCLWNSLAPLAGNTGFICPLSISVSTKLTTQFVGHKLCSQPDWLFGSIVRFQISNVAMATPTHLFCSVSTEGAESASPSIAIVRSFVCKHGVVNAPDHTAQPAATSSPQWLWSTDVSPATGDANTMLFLSAVIQPSIASKRQRQIGWW